MHLRYYIVCICGVMRYPIDDYEMLIYTYNEDFARCSVHGFSATCMETRKVALGSETGRVPCKSRNPYPRDGQECYHWSEDSCYDDTGIRRHDLQSSIQDILLQT